MEEVKSRLVKDICKRLLKVLDEESGSVISVMFRHRLASRVGQLIRDLYWSTSELSWFTIICDDSNNTAEILADEDFRLDLYWREYGYPYNYNFRICMGKDGIILRSKGYDEEEEENEEEEYDEEVFQWFIIDDDAAEFFMRFTNEPIYYSYSLNMYLLGVTHFGTAWRGVMTEWKIEEE